MRSSSVTNIDTVADTAVLNLRGLDAEVVTAHVVGGAVNATGVNLTFEGTLDGSTWFAVFGTRTNAATAELATGVVAANLGVALGYAHTIPVRGFKKVRARCTAISAGDVNVTLVAS